MRESGLQEYDVSWVQAGAFLHRGGEQDLTTVRKQAPHIPFTCEEVVANEKNKESSVHAIEGAFRSAALPSAR